ncbi:MAG TPA: SDR family oxidoreductase [Bryobacteraceae bacterium]|nr:SDR family oxidoreductase [Bryobacteraceae bacterium]
MGKLDGKVVFITGATGIGAATSQQARNQGAQVFTASLDGESFTGDLSVEANVISAVAACLKEFGRIDALFNVAGISGRRFGDGPLHECTVEAWDTLMAVNVRSQFLVSREVVRHMLERRRGGSIVNMASVLAISPEPQRFATHAYAAGKGAIIALTTSAAAYYGEHGIRFNALAPGLVQTPMSKRAQDSAEIREFIRGKQPLAEGFIEAGDVAAAALFLLSDDSRYITGEVLTVDAGWRFA